MKRLIISLASTMMFKDDLTRMAVYQFTEESIDRNTYLDEYRNYEEFKRKIGAMKRLSNDHPSSYNLPRQTRSRRFWSPASYRKTRGGKKDGHSSLTAIFGRTFIHRKHVRHKNFHLRNFRLFFKENLKWHLIPFIKLNFIFQNNCCAVFKNIAMENLEILSKNRCLIL